MTCHIWCCCLVYERRLAWWTGHSGGSLGVERMYAMYVELSLICGFGIKADRNCSCDFINLLIPVNSDSLP